MPRNAAGQARSKSSRVGQSRVFTESFAEETSLHAGVTWACVNRQNHGAAAPQDDWLGGKKPRTGTILICMLGFSRGLLHALGRPCGPLLRRPFRRTKSGVLPRSSVV